MTVIAVILALLLALAVLALWKGVLVVPQGQEWTIERFGRHVNTFEPGLNLMYPFIDRVGARVNMKEQVLDIPRQEVITRDNASVAADAVAFFLITDAAKATYEIDDVQAAITSVTMTNIRSLIGSLDLDDVLTSRERISADLLETIDQATGAWGVKVSRVDILDLEPPRDIVEAMAKQLKAERERRAEVLAAQGQRDAAVLRATGEFESAKLAADGRRVAAEAEAEATRMLSEVLSVAGNSDAINYFVAQKYVEALRDVAKGDNSKLIMMPLDSSGVIGAIAGVGELTKALRVKKE